MDIKEFKREHLEAVKDWKKDNIYNRMDWYENYNIVLDKVAKIKTELLNGAELDIKNEKHKDFLEMLLLKNECVLRGVVFKTGNGIAYVGTDKLEPEHFKSLITDNEVLKAIKNVIISPTIKTCEQLESTFRKYKSSKGKITSGRIIERVISACTIEVSSTHCNKFKEVFKMLVKQGIIPDENFGGTDTTKWYQKNIYLMGNLHKIFENEIKNGDTDKIFISMYIRILTKPKNA